MKGPVTFEVTDGVGRITLARPSAANAIDMSVAEAFRVAVDAAVREPIGAVLVVGAGRQFCAGGDVRGFLTGEDPPAYLRQLAAQMETQLRRLSELPQPVVAGVHGAVAGAGLSFVLNADVVVAGRSTRFLTAYTAVGLTPDCGVSHLLPRAVGVPRALDLALTGRVLSAEEAMGWGLVSRVVDDDAVHEHAEELARSLAGGPTWALGQTKRLIRAATETTRQVNASDEVATISAAVASADATRLIAEFLGR